MPSWTTGWYAGILDVWTLGGDEYLTFRHLTFQEYAAAHELAARWKSDAGKTWRFLRPRVHHYAWREPLLLMAGQLPIQQADRLLKLLLSARSRYERVLQRDLLLAAALVTEATVSSGMRRPIIQRLGRAASDPRTDVFLKAALSRGWTAALLAMSLGMDDSRRFSPLLLTYLTGLTMTIAGVAQGFNGFLAAVVAAVAWSGLWVGAFKIPIFWLRSLLSFPVRIWPRVHDRASALHLLAQIGDAAAIPFLLEALESRNSTVVDAAARGLGRMGEPAVSRVMQLVEEGREPIRAIAPVVLAQRGRSSAAYVIGLLAASTPGIRWAASRAVGEIGDRAALPGLVEILSDPVPLIRKAAADALSKMPDPSAVAPLMIAAGDADARVASAAAHALGCIGDPRSVPALIHVLDKAADFVRAGLWRRTIDEESGFEAPPIAWEVYAAVAEALGRIGGDDARAALVRMAKYGYPLTEATDPALAQMDKKADGASATAPAHETTRTEATAPSVADTVAAPEALMPQLLAALKARKSGAADALAELSARLSNPRHVRRIARLLWWRLTDDDGDHALEALARVTNRLTILEVQAIETRREPPARPASGSEANA